MFSVIPFFRSLVVATCCSLLKCRPQGVPASQCEQFPGGGGEQVSWSEGPFTAHDEDVLDPDTAHTRQVDARLDGDGDPGSESTRASVPEGWCLVDLEADAVAEPVLEVLGVPGVADHVPGGRVHFAQVRAGCRRG